MLASKQGLMRGVYQHQQTRGPLVSQRTQRHRRRSKITEAARAPAQVEEASKPANSNCVQANFSVQGKVAFGEWLRLVGSSKEFGRWGPLEGPLLRWTEGDVWKTSVYLPIELKTLEFKVVVCHEQGGDPQWEQGPNRVLEVPSEPGVLDHTCVWNSTGGASTSFKPGKPGSAKQPPQQKSSPTLMSALPSWGTVDNATPPPGSSASHSQQEQDSSSSNRTSTSGSSSFFGSLQQASGQSSGNSRDVFGVFGLEGTAAVLATTLACILFGLILGEGAKVLHRQRKGAPPPSTEQVFPRAMPDTAPSSVPEPTPAPTLRI